MYEPTTNDELEDLESEESEEVEEVEAELRNDFLDLEMEIHCPICGEPLDELVVETVPNYELNETVEIKETMACMFCKEEFYIERSEHKFSIQVTESEHFNGQI